VQVTQDGSDAGDVQPPRLDTLRADLGLFGFPSRTVVYLSTFTPAFYIRQRDSKTVNCSPYLISYSGCPL
jgi:hypothetical protein